MITLNFGPGGKSLYPREISFPSGMKVKLPDTPIDIVTTDQIVVPETGELRSFDWEVDEGDLTYDPRWPRFLYRFFTSIGILQKLDYSVNRIVLSTPEQRPGVVITLPDLPQIKKYSVEKFTTFLIWIKERREWIAVAYREFVQAGGGPGFSYSGPFGFNGLCRSALSRAYGLADVPTDIESWPPQKLETEN